MQPDLQSYWAWFKHAARLFQLEQKAWGRMKTCSPPRSWTDHRCCVCKAKMKACVFLFCVFVFVPAAVCFTQSSSRSKQKTLRSLFKLWFLEKKSSISDDFYTLNCTVTAPSCFHSRASHQGPGRMITAVEHNANQYNNSSTQPQTLKSSITVFFIIIKMNKKKVKYQKCSSWSQTAEGVNLCLIDSRWQAARVLVSHRREQKM